MLTRTEFWGFIWRIIDMLMVEDFEILSDMLLIRIRCRILRFYSTSCWHAHGDRILRFYLANYRYAHGRGFWDFIRHVTYTLKVQNFEILFDELLTCSRGQNFEVLSEKLRTRSRHRILTFYPTNYKYVHCTEFWKFILKISNMLTVQNRDFIRQIRVILTVGSFVVLPDIFDVDPICT